MSGKIISIPSLLKLQKLKWLALSHLFLMMLTLSSLLLAELRPVHGEKRAIDIDLHSGATLRITQDQIVSNTHFRVKLKGKGNKGQAHVYIGTVHISIDRSKSLIQHIRSLRATQGIKSAKLNTFLSDEGCENKIGNSNTTFLSDSDLPTQQYQLGCTLTNLAYEFGKGIPFLQKAIDLLTQSSIAGFQPAKEMLPLVQNNLAVSLAYLAQESEEGFSLLREAVELLTQSAEAGCQLAKRNLPIEQYKLGVMLANSAQNSPDKIRLLKESIYFLTESVSAGDPYAKKNLPIAQYNLGCTLANSAKKSVERVSFLREAVKVLTESLLGGYQRAGKKLSAVEYQLGCALANSEEGSEDEVPHLREAMFLLESSLNSSFQKVETFPYIHATLKKINKRLKALLKQSHSQHQQQNGPF
ncbi:MAG: hypothetical protein K2Y08_04220 [Alphaproteobacteria bacterium]|nr:hypothetical protein [Alphaproteobacteria bacterium]